MTSRLQRCPAAPGRDRPTGFRRPYATAPRPGTGAMTATYITDDTRTYPEYADRARQHLQNSAVRPNSGWADEWRAARNDDDPAGSHGLKWIPYRRCGVVRLGMTDRRAFLWGMTLGTIFLPLAANAQRSGKVYRIGVLWSLPAPLLMTRFVESLRELGWVEGRDFTLAWIIREK